MSKVAIPVSAFWQTCKQHLRDHTCLWAIVGSCTLAATFTTGQLLHASQKYGVKWNRWKVDRSHEAIRWDKHDQKMFVVSSVAKSLYKEDPSLKGLLNEIYEDGRYD